LRSQRSENNQVNLSAGLSLATSFYNRDDPDWAERIVHWTGVFLDYTKAWTEGSRLQPKVSRPSAPGEDATFFYFGDMGRGVRSSDDVVSFFSKKSAVSLRSDITAQYHRDYDAVVAKKLDKIEFFDGLLQGKYTTPRSAFYPNPSNTLELKAKQCNVNLTWGTYQYRVKCVFLPVANVISRIFPSILAPLIPELKNRDYSWQRFSTALVGDNLKNDDFLALARLFIDYVSEKWDKSDLKKRFGRTAVEVKKMLNEDFEFIFGDNASRRVDFSARRARIAHQWDELFLHFMHKYHHGTVSDDEDKRDYIAAVAISGTTEAISRLNRANRLYSLQDSSDIWQTAQLQKTSGLRDKMLIQSNTLREFVVSSAALKCFEGDKTKPRIWLTAIPDAIEILATAPLPDQPDRFVTGWLGRGLTAVYNLALGVTKPELLDLDMNTDVNKTLRLPQNLTKFHVNVTRATEVLNPLSVREKRRFRSDLVLFHNKGLEPAQIRAYVDAMKPRPKKVPAAAADTTTQAVSTESNL
jgi:hypothetical protein